MVDQPHNIFFFIVDQRRGDQTIDTRLKISRPATNWAANPCEPDDDRFFSFDFGPNREMYP